ncbi:SIMPL domain-containing protein [Candidatus Omnitrophota bacterium]
MKKSGVFILVAVILGLSLVWVANIASNTAISIKNKGYVKVKGFAKQEIRSDLAIFSVRIEEADVDLKACYRKLKDDKEKANKFLEKYEAKDDIIKFYQPKIRENYKINERGHATDEFIDFELTQKFSVQSDDVEKIERLTEEISGLLDEGVKLFISSPDYIYKDLDALKVEMIGRATANAKERAEVIAKKGKFRLGPIASVRVGVFQITPAYSTSVSNYGINDTTSIDKEIKSVVEIEYFVR